MGHAAPILLQNVLWQEIGGLYRANVRHPKTAFHWERPQYPTSVLLSNCFEVGCIRVKLMFSACNSLWVGFWGQEWLQPLSYFHKISMVKLLRTPKMCLLSVCHQCSRVLEFHPGLMLIPKLVKIDLVDLKMACEHVTGQTF